MSSIRRASVLAAVLAVSIWIPAAAVADDIEIELPSNNADDAFRITDSDGETVMIVESGGYVGIGVPDPDTPLQVSYALKVGSLSGLASPFIMLEGSAGSVDAMGLYSASRNLYVGTANPTLMFRTSGWPRMTIDSSGNVGIGTITPAYDLDVDGDINVSGEIYRNGAAYTHPDYVFEPDYALMDLEELRAFVATAKHLPGMPSKEDVSLEGVKLFEQNRLLLEKLEEAYLYIFELKARVDQLESTLGARD